MKKMFYGVAVLLMVSLGLFIGCKKTEQSASVGTTAKEEVKSQGPIIVGDMRDFQFTPGWNVSGTVFQSDFLWFNQNGQRVQVQDLTGTDHYTITDVPKRFDFTKGDPVTVVFKVTYTNGLKTVGYVSIEKK